MDRHQVKLALVEPTPLDTVRQFDPSIVGQSPGYDLLCGKCGNVVLADTSVEEAQHFFVGETGRTIAECSQCLGNNLLSTKVREDRDLFGGGAPHR